MNMRLSVIFLAIAVIASALAHYRVSWEAGATNHDFLLGVYLIVVAGCAVAAIPRNARFRAGMMGAALFGIAYLICSLQGGFGMETIYDARTLAKNTKIGLAQLGVAFLVSQFLAALLWPKDSQS